MARSERPSCRIHAHPRTNLVTSFPFRFLHRIWLCLCICLLRVRNGASAYTLITFDVDGTLVRGSGKAADASAHARSFAHACGRVLDAKNGGAPTPPVADVLPRRLYHGSTDGLILCRLARAALGASTVSESELKAMMDEMYAYVSALGDAEIARGIEVLPGVTGHLESLRDLSPDVVCGLVTGNVEGIARRKMRAVGVWGTGALAAPAPEQTRREWSGVEDVAFLGGFGSDYCSRDVDDIDRNFLDRGEQIAVAARRCREVFGSGLTRVVHVGDAPADVLAAKAFAERQATEDDPVVVGAVGVATGSYSADQLRECTGEAVLGRWEPVVLERGMADPAFLEACGIRD